MPQECVARVLSSSFMTSPYQQSHQNWTELVHNLLPYYHLPHPKVPSLLRWSERSLVSSDKHRCLVSTIYRPEEAIREYWCPCPDLKLLYSCIGCNLPSIQGSGYCKNRKPVQSLIHLRPGRFFMIFTTTLGTQCDKIFSVAMRTTRMVHTSWYQDYIALVDRVSNVIWVAFGRSSGPAVGWTGSRFCDRYGHVDGLWRRNWFRMARCLAFLCP